MRYTVILIQSTGCELDHKEGDDVGDILRIIDSED